MPDGRKPGPQWDDVCSIDGGTLGRSASPIPRPLGMQLYGLGRMSTTDKLLEAMRRTTPKLPEGMRQEFAALLSPEAIGITAAVLTAWAASHFFGVGEIVDVLLLITGAVFLGWQAFDAARDICLFVDIASDAETVEDLELAADHLARAVSVLGVGVITALIAKAGGKLGKRPSKSVITEEIKPRAGVMTEIEIKALLFQWEERIRLLDLAPGRDKGVLWSKLGNNGDKVAESLARQKNLRTLEMVLKDSHVDINGLIKAEVGDVKNDVTYKIWEKLSVAYARSLEGHVNAFVDMQAVRDAVDGPMLLARLRGLPDPKHPPLILHELMEISEVMRVNPKITGVYLHDLPTGNVLTMTRDQVLQAAKYVH